MMQAHPIPDMHARGSLGVQCVTGGASALVGACERADQVQLRAGIDYPADAAQHSIHFAKSPESIDVNRLQARGLREQFFVGHFCFSPHWSRGNSGTCLSDVRSQSYNLMTKSIPHCVVSDFETSGTSFVAATPSDECALTIECPTSSPAMVSACNFIITPDSARRT